ncbi:MAG: hypothetical protein F6J86_47550 [Symploca sp. SIO1B1]|nr:hypothetical protein [Symploca sp. SIO1B1]
MFLSRELRELRKLRELRELRKLRKKNTIFLTPWVFPYIESFLAHKHHIWELTKCTTL